MALYNRLEESVPSLTHFSRCLSPLLAASPLLSRKETGEVKPERNSCLGQVGGNRRVGRWEDAERPGGSDETGPDITTAGGEEESTQAETQQT